VSYVYNVGDKKLPLTSLSSNPPEYMEQMGQYVIHGGLFETNKYLVLDYRFGKNSTAFIDKETNKIYLNHHELNGNSIKSGISNDVDGGLMIMLNGFSYYTDNNVEYLIGLIDAYELKTHIDSPEFKNSVPKYPEKKNALTKFANTLNETDNQILMMIRLKK
jgi:ribosomal protein S1